MKLIPPSESSLFLVLGCLWDFLFRCETGCYSYFFLLTWKSACAYKPHMYFENLLHTCVLQISLFWGFRWPDGFLLYFPTDYFCQEDLLGQSNKELIPSNWLWFLSFLLENIITEPPYFLFKFDMEAEGDAYFHSQLVVFVLGHVSIILKSTHLPYYLRNPSSDYRLESYIVGWFVKGWKFFLWYLQWFRRALRSCSIDFHTQFPVWFITF